MFQNKRFFEQSYWLHPPNAFCLSSLSSLNILSTPFSWNHRKNVAYNVVKIHKYIKLFKIKNIDQIRYKKSSKSVFLDILSTFQDAFVLAIEHKLHITFFMITVNVKTFRILCVMLFTNLNIFLTERLTVLYPDDNGPLISILFCLLSFRRLLLVILLWCSFFHLIGNYSIKYLSRIVRKPDFCLGENKGADQLRGNREADQRLCFRYTDSIFRLLLISEISSF